MNKWFHSFFSPHNWFLWCSVCLLVNVFYFQVRREHLGQKEFYSIGGDAEQYVGSAESLYQNGEFRMGRIPRASNFATPDDLKAVDYAFRTPGFAVFYLPIRFVLSKDLTCKTIITLQIILSALSKYLLCLILLKLCSNNLLFYVCFLIINISPYSVLFNSFLLPESLARSLLIIAFYIYFKRNRLNTINILIMGLCLFEVFWLRPFMGILFPLFMLLFLIEDRKIVWQKHILFVLPLLLLQPLWIYRNYVVTGKIIPISATLAWKQVSNKVYLSAFKLTQITGGDTEFWNETSPMYWLLNNPTDTIVPKIYFERLKSIPASQINQIVKGKHLFQTSIDETLLVSKRMKAELEGEKIMKAIIQSETGEHPIQSKLKSNYHYCQMLLDQPILRYFASIKYPFNILFTAIEFFVTRLVFYFGIFCCVFFCFKFGLKPNQSTSRVFAISFVPIFLLLFFSNLGSNEFRELYLAFPFLILLILLYMARPMKWHNNYLLLLIFTIAILANTKSYILESFRF